MQLCFLLDTSGFPIEAADSKNERKENRLKNALLNTRLDTLQEEGLISGYTTIEGTYLGFPFSRPIGTIPYRADYVVRDLDRIVQEYESGEARLERLDAKKKGIRGWQNTRIISLREVKRAKKVRRLIYDQAHTFFGADDISRWTEELDALEGADPNFKEKDKRGYKNKLSKEAFLALVYSAGYVIARAVVASGKLPQLEQSLNDEYIRRTIRV